MSALPYLARGRQIRWVLLGLTASLFLVGCEANPKEHETDPIAKATIVSVGSIEVSVDQLAAEAFADAGIEVEGALSKPLERIQELIPVPEIEISLQGDPKDVIEAVGVLGRSFPSGDILVNIDQTRSDLQEVINVWLPQTLAHEVMHSSRLLEGAGKRKTLLDHFVEEGLADTFSLEAFPQTPAIPWVNALSPAEVPELWKRAKRELDSEKNNAYFKWFFEGAEVPHWTGYTVGFAVVQSYLDLENMTPSESLGIAAKEIVADSAFALGANQ